MYGGDYRNCLENVRREMRRLKYSKPIDYSALLRGQQSVLIEIYRFLFCEYNQAVTKYLSEKGFDLSGMSDRKFMETVYRCIRDILCFKPCISLCQFFSSGFAERKMEMLVSVSQGIQSRRDILVKPMVQKSVHTRSILETLNGRTKENEPEIIEISPVRKRDKRLRIAKKSNVKSSLSDSKANNKFPSDSQNVAVLGNSNAIDSTGCKNSQQISLSEIASHWPSGESQTEMGVQTNTNANVEMLGDIASKLDNIVARIAILESRMSFVESRLPTSDSQEFTNVYQTFPSPMKESERMKLTSNELVSDNDSHKNVNQQRRPVEAVVINRTNQTNHAVKLLRFYDDHEKKEISDRSKNDSLMNYNLHNPGNYSPSLYRRNSVDDKLEQKENFSTNEDSEVTSEDSDLEAEIENQVRQSGGNEDLLLEHPVKLNERGPDSCEDNLKSQVSRIQEMINSTNILLSKTE